MILASLVDPKNPERWSSKLGWKKMMKSMKQNTECIKFYQPRRPSLIESNIETSRNRDSNIYILVLEELGPTLEDLCRVLSRNNERFDEEMSLALTIQTVRDFFPSLVHKYIWTYYSFDKAWSLRWSSCQKNNPQRRKTLKYMCNS